MPKRPKSNPNYSRAIEPPTNQELRVLLQKMSRQPLWAELKKLSKKSYPKWRVTQRPKLMVLKDASVVYRYSMPHGKTKDFRVRGVKVASLSELPSPKAPQEFSQGNKPLLGIAEKLFIVGRNANEQYDADFERMTIVWDAICAAFAASYFVKSRWNSLDPFVGQSDDPLLLLDDQSLGLIAPVFEAVGINAKKVLQIGLGASSRGVSISLDDVKLEDFFDPFTSKLWKAKNRIKLEASSKNKILRKSTADLPSTIITKKVKQFFASKAEKGT